MRIAKTIPILFFAFIGLFLLVFGVPIMNPTPGQCNIVSGKMYQFNVNEGSKDIQLQIEDDNGRYYINRGLENGMDAKIMRNLEGNEIKVWYARHWSLINYKSLVRHVCKITLNGETVYSEFKES
jgi:hypothetical protein